MRLKIAIVTFFLFGYFVFVGQTISTVAGNGTGSFAGDGGAATSAALHGPCGLAFDANGNMYIAEYGGNQRVRKINTSGVISTFAGNGTTGYSGDGGAATGAELSGPGGVVADASGNIYVVDCNNNRIRMINTGGIITTIAGTGTAGFGGDGGLATAAQLNNPSGIVIDGSGNIYVADKNNNRIRKINTSGVISTFAGNGTAGFSGDGGAAGSASLNAPTRVTIDLAGNIYVTDYSNNRVRKISTSGVISTFAGNGTGAFLGDGGLATSAELHNPNGITVDATGNVYIADANNNRIRVVNPSGIITTVAGNGTAGFSGDGGLGTSAEINSPWGLTTDPSGNVYIADYNNNRVRKILVSSASSPCNNIDFEAGDTTGWHITGNYLITSGTGTDPFGGFPTVYPGGSHSLRLNNNDTATTKFTASASRLISVTSANAYLNLHYAMDILNYPHDSAAAAKFHINLFDQAGVPISCPDVDTYFCLTSGNIGGYHGVIDPNTTPGTPGVNVGGQTFSVLYQKWETITINLTPYIGQNVTCKIECDWCEYNYDWAYCYIDADCSSSYPNSMIITQSNPLCTGGITTLSGPPGMTGYSWTGPVTGSSRDLVTTVAGNYTLNITSAGACNFPPLFYTVTPSSSVAPTISISIPQNPACMSTTTTLTASGANTYTWSTGIQTNTLAITPTSVLNYTVVGTSTATACANLATLTVSVTPTPTVTVNSSSFCTSGSHATVLTPTVTPSAAYTYSWTPATGLSSTSVSNPTSTLTNTTVTYSVTATPTAGCVGRGVATVSVRPFPVVTVNSATVCQGSPAVLSASGASTYTWSTGSSGATTTLSPSSTSVYTVTGKSAYNCTATATSTITVNPLPVVLVNSDTICSSSTSTLTASGAGTYTWVPSTFLNTTSGATVVTTPTSNITYTVTGIGSNGCKKSAISNIITSSTYTVYPSGKSVCVVPNTEIAVYNSFSPNGDGLNDFFEIDNIDLYTPNHVYIYNRWGQLLWDKSGYDNKNVVWDGKDSNGNLLAPGTYFYLIEVNGQKTRKHWLELTK